MCAYFYVYICTCFYVHTCMHTCICIYTHVCNCLYSIYVYKNAKSCVCVAYVQCKYRHVYACVEHVCVYYICVHM